MQYDPSNWWWLVGNREGVVFSSALPGYVQPSDAGYAAFVAAGGNPTKILCDGELADVLLKAGLPNAAVAAAGATDFGPTLSPAEKLAIVQAIGVALSSAGTPALDATYELSGQQWADMRDEAQYVQTFGAFSTGATLDWIARTGTVSFATTAQFLAVVRGLADYLSAWKQYFAGTGALPAALGTAAIA